MYNVTDLRKIHRSACTNRVSPKNAAAHTAPHNKLYILISYIVAGSMFMITSAVTFADGLDAKHTYVPLSSLWMSLMSSEPFSSTRTRDLLLSIGT